MKYNSLEPIPAFLIKKLLKESLPSVLAWGNKMIKINPNSADAYIIRGYAHSEMSRFREALRDYEFVIKIDPDLMEPYLYLANTYYNLNEFNRAIAYYNIFLTRKPGDIEAIQNKIQSKSGLGLHKEAIHDCCKQINLHPENPVFYWIRGFEKMELGFSLDAYDDFTESIRLNPDDPIPYFGRSFTINQSNEASIADLNKAIELDPKFDDAYYNRAYLKTEIDDFKGALDDYNKTIELDPNNFEAYLDREIVKVILKKFVKE